MASTVFDTDMNIDNALESAGLKGVVQRLELTASLDTWVYHDREKHCWVADGGIRFFTKDGVCVGMHRLTNNTLMVAKLDIGIPNMFHPKTGMYAHQMDPVKSPYDFETAAKDLIMRYEVALVEWGKATERVKHGWDTCPDQNIPTMKGE